MKFFARKQNQRVTNFALAAMIVLSTLTASVPFIFSQKANAAVGVTTSTQTAPNGWYTEDGAPTYVAGPTGATGNGSLKFQAPTISSKNNFFHQVANLPLGQVTGLGYSLYDTAGIPASYQLEITGAKRLNSTTRSFTTLVWEPVYNGQSNGPTTGFVSESNVEKGTWWSSNPIAGAPDRNTFVSLQTILAANPGAVVIAYGSSVGSGTPGAVSYVDNIRFGDTTTDFVLAPLAAPTNLQFNYKDANEVDQTLACGGIINSNKAKIWHESGSLNLNWTAPAGVVTGYQVSVTGPTGSYVSYGGPNAWSWLQFTQGDGTYTYSVRANSDGGLSQPSTSCSIVYDHTAPVVTVTPVAGSLLHGTETFNISVADVNLDAAASHVYVYLYNNGGTQKSKGATVDLSSGHATFTVDTTKLDDGLATFDVGRFADAAGNFTGTSDTYFKNYQIDNTIPNAPTGLFFSANDTTLTNLTVKSVLNNKIVLGWTDPTNSPSGIIQHITQVDGPNGYTNQFWNGYPNTWLNTNGGEFGQHGDGAYTYKVKVENAAGTWSDWSTPVTLIYDTVAPTATINGYAPVTVYGAGTNIDVHAIDANYLQTDLYLNSSTEPFKTYNGTYFGLFWLVNGNYRMVVRDSATNSKEYDFTIDKTAPDAPVVSATRLTSGDATNQGSVNILWTTPSTDTVKYDYKVWTNIAGDAYNGVGNAYAANGLTGNSRSGAFTEGQGSYFIQVRAYDAAGNVSPWSNTFTVIYDTTAPEVAITSPTNGTTYGKNGSPVKITGTTGDAASYTLSITNTGQTPLVTTSGTSFDSYAWDTTGVASGSYVATLTGTDTAGNLKTSTVVINIDNTAPTVVITPQTDTSGNQPTITGTVNDVNAVLTASFKGSTGIPVTNNAGTFSFAVPSPLANGTYTFAIAATDVNGNSSSQTANVIVAVAAPATTPATRVTPLITPASTAAVLGATTDNTSKGDTSVKGATDDKTVAAAVNSGANQDKIFGLAWYWWILIIAALAAIAWFIIAAIRRRNERQA